MCHIKWYHILDAGVAIILPLQKWLVFSYKLKYISLQFTATLNYVCTLPSLLHVNWFVFPECFLLTSKFTTGKKVLVEGSNLAVVAAIVNVYLFRSCSGLLAHVGTCGHYNHSKHCHLFCSVTFLYWFLLLTLPPTFPTHLNIYTCPKLMHSLSECLPESSTIWFVRLAM